MAHLVPEPLGHLVTRMFGELTREDAVFHLPRARFATADPERDLSVEHHGRRASTPFGPAAGPHTQLAQNIVLSWLCGGRVLELKTVQVRDDLVIARPCIDVQTVGFNVEWSQELKVSQSLEEYVKAMMLVELLKAEGAAPGLSDTVYDLSVGYDLAGVRSDKVRAFLAEMKDAGRVVDRLRGQIPAPWARLRDLPFPTRVADTLTLSTFHGCPPGEIEGIAAHLLREEGLEVTVKLNPTLVGREAMREILQDRLGYHELAVPDAAFDKDTSWSQAVDLVGRLGELATSLGRGFGVKLTNTLIVRNHKPFFPASEKEMYLSGAPLHVLATQLVARFRRTFGDRFPVSFSAGIDAQNFADAAALGLRPITACTDLLRPGGYGRAAKYLADLKTRMAAAGASDLDAWAILGPGNGLSALADLGLPPAREAACRAALAAVAPGGASGGLRAAAGEEFPRWVSAARLRNTTGYAERVLVDPRYAAARNSQPPRKVGSRLSFFDCLTCDKCVPVCPNDANFTLPVAGGPIARERLVPEGTGFRLEADGALPLAKPRQIANFADACNECGNCDVMCPEDGGPYLVKPRFFGTPAALAASPLDGLAVERRPGGYRVEARFEGKRYTLETGGPGARDARYAADGFDLRLDPADPAATARGAAGAPVDLTWLRVMDRILQAVIEAGPTTWPGAALEHQAGKT